MTEIYEDMMTISKEFNFSTQQVLAARNAKFGQFKKQTPSEYRSVDSVLKRMSDLFIAATALILLSPIFLIIALAIKLDSPGPVFFKQRRLGLNSVTFNILKFRSMTVMENDKVVTQAKKGDARITRVGKFIRSTSIDELPQLINVLMGQMSIVGPRPHALAHDEYYGQAISTYNARRSAKPGITGWAQANGLRGETPRLEMMADRVAHDLWYIQNWSIWLDLRILLKTVVALTSTQNVY
jgi:putative colanic acid biosynthesis UDP-glucose lipid carrier transferase